MRPINLLPEDQRPRSTSGGLKGSSYALLGVLGTVLVMLLALVLSSNQVNARKSEIARAKHETERANARVAELAPYAAFSGIKETRLESVKDLATVRFDWERLMRELALVLPRGTWLTDLTASTAPDGSQAGGVGAGPGSSPAATSGSSSTPSSGSSSTPSVQLSGCARHQPDVAVLMVRLRKLHGATDVELGESAEQEAQGGGAAGGDGAPNASAEGCPGNRFKFDLTVTFTPAPDKGHGKRVPASLGGGS